MSDGIFGQELSRSRSVEDLRRESRELAERVAYLERLVRLKHEGGTAAASGTGALADELFRISQVDLARRIYIVVRLDKNQPQIVDEDDGFAGVYYPDAAGAVPTTAYARQGTLYSIGPKGIQGRSIAAEIEGEDATVIELYGVPDHHQMRFTL